MYKVQAGVPVQKAARPNRQSFKYPLDTMEKGDFFFVPDKERNTLSQWVSTRGKQLKRKFTTSLCYMRKTRDGWSPCEADAKGATLGVGVWRVK